MPIRANAGERVCVSSSTITFEDSRACGPIVEALMAGGSLVPHLGPAGAICTLVGG